MQKALSIFLCSTIIFSNFLFLSSCEKKDNLSIKNSEKEEKIAFSKEKDNIFKLNIYFDSSHKNGKAQISKEKRIIKKDELLAEAILNELIDGPSVKSNLYPILDKNTKVISVSIKDNIAYINLSKEANKKMSPQKEEACIKSIVLSLTQIPTINKVKISIDNSDSNLFGNNFDLSKPIGRKNLKSIKLE